MEWNGMEFTSRIKSHHLISLLSRTIIDLSEPPNIMVNKNHNWVFKDSKQETGCIKKDTSTFSTSYLR